MTRSQDIKAIITTYVLDELLGGAPPSEITDTAPLIATGMLDSVSTLRLVVFLEEQFAVSLDAHDVGLGAFETIQSITQLVTSKLAAPLL